MSSVLSHREPSSPSSQDLRTAQNCQAPTRPVRRAALARGASNTKPGQHLFIGIKTQAEEVQMKKHTFESLHNLCSSASAETVHASSCRQASLLVFCGRLNIYCIYYSILNLYIMYILYVYIQLYHRTSNY